MLDVLFLSRQSTTDSHYENSIQDLLQGIDVIDIVLYSSSTEKDVKSFKNLIPQLNFQKPVCKGCGLAFCIKEISQLLGFPNLVINTLGSVTIRCCTAECADNTLLHFRRYVTLSYITCVAALHYLLIQDKQVLHYIIKALLDTSHVS